ncbi:DUF4189 domain-containing protein [Caulobacter mirabilis]|uniref:DUF4189 domain-containing protein n=1 Tax=Caulobacter mirabilis TaxID=69666 RepID=A0A2D2B2R0_9CAUL|nr:DUF4189 domain-containing protein [Caulobacter mirabilis]ATQ44518.1 hypothetical protein CSW64_20070 [Caulobacter mirabilis]
MKRLLFTLAASMAALAAFSAMPDRASAQPYPCPGSGPGPDEVIVGMVPATPSQAAFPLCARKNTAPAQRGLPSVSQPQIQMMPRIPMRPLYGIHVTDAERSALYSANGFYTPTEAEQAALNHCDKQTGHKCVSIGSFADSCQVIAIGPRKQIYKGIGRTPRESARAGMAACMRDHPVADCSLWRIPLCSGLLYGEDVFHAGANNLPDNDEVDRIKVRLTAEVVAEINGRK